MAVGAVSADRRALPLSIVRASLCQFVGAFRCLVSPCLLRVYGVCT
jgi:hypothetical protein